MRNILAGVLLLLFFIPGLAAAATINAASCSYADVQTAINSAQSGDTVLVPSGSCTWNNNLVITKGIYLIGAGIGNTIITSNYTAPDPSYGIDSRQSLIVFKPATPSTNPQFRLSGFSIDLGAKCLGICLYNPTRDPCNKIRLDHIHIYNPINSGEGYGTVLVRYGSVYGVMDSSVVVGNIANMGLHSYWNFTPYNFGDENNFYFEDNEWNGEGLRSFYSDGNEAPRYAIRHNRIDGSSITREGLYPLCDLHGNQASSGHAASQGAEVYENNITMGTKWLSLMDHRGGKVLIYNNAVTATGAGGFSMRVREEENDNLMPPANNLITGQPQHVADSYYWGNRLNGATIVNPYILAQLDYGGEIGLVPQENRDFWVEKTSFDGTAGVGVGLLSARPAACTTGVGYWANDTKTLYKCNATDTWIADYTPYIYPHPLRTDCTNYPTLCDSSAATITAASCSYADVLAAVNAAQSGDTVLVPAGSCTWNNTLVITKGITLQGAGIDQTTLIGQVIFISFEPDADAKLNHDTLKIKGFTFDGANSSSEQLHWSGLIVGGGTTPDYVNLVILNNKFKNTLATGIMLRGIYGVAAYNQFDSVAMVIRIMGNDYNSWSTQTQDYGTANNFFFENNNIFFSSPAWCGYAGGWPGWIETGQGGRIVVRYNTWDEANNQPGEYWDVHGLQNIGSSGKCEGYSTMVAEYYGNNILHATTGYRWMYHRGGWLMMYNNALDNPNSYGGGSGVTQYYCDTCQERGSFKQKATNSYFWNNRQNSEIQEAYISDPGAGFGCPSDPIIENVDFFNHNASCTKDSCSAGVGCGSDTPTGTCTPGVGYWKTSQSCSDLSGMVGANPATPITGTFYKCTSANTWTTYYIPYVYPHPLASGSSPPQPVPGDINGDRLVDINDLALMALHFGQTNMHASWDITVDVVADNEIDIYDIVFVSTRFM